MSNMTAFKFRATARLGTVYALEGLCSFFPHDNPRSARLSDRMWGLDHGDAQADRDLRHAGRRVCELCPVRRQCLADAMVNQLQDGVYGGLGRTERKTLARIAEHQGLPMRGVLVRGMPALSASEALRRRTLVAAWLEDHPEMPAVVREHEARTRREHRHRQQAQPTSTPPPIER